MARLSGGRLVTEAKVLEYLLNAEHPQGKSKAQYFARFGFSDEDHVALLEALLTHPDSNEIVQVQENDFGTKSTVQCQMKTPDGRDPCILSVWFLERGSAIQRLVTAYPAEQPSHPTGT